MKEGAICNNAKLREVVEKLMDNLKIHAMSGDAEASGGRQGASRPLNDNQETSTGITDAVPACACHKPLTLDEAIAHADEVAGDCSTACRMEHKQLADWLRELRGLKASRLGDFAKMREALEQLYEQICHGETERNVVANRQMIRAALAAPVRNCDVGTAKEQLKRFKDFCRIISKDETCDGCPLLPQCSTLEHCTLAWAQTSYE